MSLMLVTCVYEIFQITLIGTKLNIRVEKVQQLTEPLGEQSLVLISNYSYVGY